MRVILCVGSTVYGGVGKHEPEDAGGERPCFSIRNCVIRFAQEKDLCISVGDGVGVAGRPTSCNNFD